MSLFLEPLWMGPKVALLSRSTSPNNNNKCKF